MARYILVVDVEQSERMASELRSKFAAKEIQVLGRMGILVCDIDNTSPEAILALDGVYSVEIDSTISLDDAE
jgi:hypothetical protein